jgi:hypothetical protein
MSDASEEQTVVAEFTKNTREVVRVGLQTFKGHNLLQLRAWALKDGADAIPTKSGIALRIELIAPLRAALDAAEAEAKARGWLG